MDPEQARRDVASGKALLVCAYDDEEKCRQYRLANALSLAELKAREATLPKDREIIFYCA
jgi:rhodanese-related sulfurtransferase